MNRKPAVLALGFRPFFILASIASCILLGLWVLAYMGKIAINPHGGVMAWHGHEMIFGYTTAVLAGFFLTAVRNWTGKPTPDGFWLGLMALLWFLGRLAPFMPEQFARLIGARLDIIFLPILAGVILKPICQARQWRNIGFPMLLLVLALGNISFHLSWMGETTGNATMGLTLSLNMVLLIIVWVFGRIFPFFSSRVCPNANLKTYKPLEAMAGISVAAWALAPFLSLDARITAALAGAGAIIHILRIWGFHHRGLWRHPLLWILYVGYLWLCVGFLLNAMIPTGYVNPLIARHAFAAGAVGVITLGMIVRVGLGHTGRPLKASGTIVVAFVLLNLAVMVRVILPLFLPTAYLQWVMVSGILWVFCFAIFSWRFIPILARPRPDGKPG